MKKGILILLWTAAIVFAGHDDWRRPPSNTPTTGTPEPATLLPVAGAIGVAIWMKQRPRAESVRTEPPAASRNARGAA